MNSYTLDALLFQRKRLEQMLKDAEYADQIDFWTKTLAEVNKDIENIEKNSAISRQNATNSRISE